MFPAISHFITNNYDVVAWMLQFVLRKKTIFICSICTPFPLLNSQLLRNVCVFFTNINWKKTFFFSCLKFKIHIKFLHNLLKWYKINWTYRRDHWHLNINLYNWANDQFRWKKEIKIEVETTVTFYRSYIISFPISFTVSIRSIWMLI